jgi:MYXO-CTERM domain-containing protein
MFALLVLLAFEGPPLQVPWQCGVTKPCTQGHNGFSHTGTSEFAWDFDVNHGEEVWAASAGTVTHIRMNMPDGGCDESYAPDANYVVVDHGDGTSITYVHLLADSSPLELGDAIVPGMLIGHVGLSGYVCGDHLHLQVMETCGSSYCASVPATFVDYGDPAQGDSIESTNCPACTLELDGTQTLVSELDPGCFVRQTTAWWSAFSGDDDHHFYTMATDAAEAESTGTWRFGVAVPGDYTVEVFVPDADADATGAVYTVHHAAGTDAFPIDQATAKGWQQLGTFAFDGTEGESVVLGDNTGEAVALERKLGYDAVRFTFVPSAGETGDTGTADTGSADDTGGGSLSATATASASDTGSEGTDDGVDPDGTGSDDASLPVTFGEMDDDSGCACASTPTTPPWWLLVVLGIPRRRRAIASRT